MTIGEEHAVDHGRLQQMMRACQTELTSLLKKADMARTTVEDVAHVVKQVGNSEQQGQLADLQALQTQLNGFGLDQREDINEKGTEIFNKASALLTSITDEKPVNALNPFVREAKHDLPRFQQQFELSNRAYSNGADNVRYLDELLGQRGDASGESVDQSEIIRLHIGCMEEVLESGISFATDILPSVIMMFHWRILHQVTGPRASFR